MANTKNKCINTRDARSFKPVLQIAPPPLAQASNKLSRASDLVIRLSDFSRMRESLGGRSTRAPPCPQHHYHHQSTLTLVCAQKSRLCPRKWAKLEGEGRVCLGSPLWREALRAAEVASIYNAQAQLIKPIVKHFADPKCHINAK